MTSHHQEARRGLLHDGKVNKPDDPTVTFAPNDRELPEVLVKRHEDTTFLSSPREDGDVSRIRRPVSRSDDIVTVGTQLSRGLPGKARVQQDFHKAEATGNASHRSCPTIRRANTRQARMSSGSIHG